MEFFADKIRNVALIGHTGEGKTTVCEAMLLNAKVIDRMGKTEDGNTVMDFDAEEAARRVSVSLSVANLVWNETKFNIIDVPGFFDFEGEEVAAMRAADGAIVVVSASGGISVGAEKALSFCLRQHIPVIVFINQMDKENADYVATVDALRLKFANKIAPIQIPVMDAQKKMQGYISLLTGNSYEFSEKGLQTIEMPAAYKADFGRLKDNLIEVAASNDETLMNKFFEGEAISAEEVVLGVRKAIATNDAIAVMAGSAAQNRGIINLMNQIERIMPSPADAPKTALNADGGEVPFPLEENQPFSCQVFKTIADPFVGRFNLFKVMSGSIKPGVTLQNVTQGKQEKISAVFTMRGKKQENVDVLHTGDIGAFTKLLSTQTGDSLCDEKRPVTFPPIRFPEPNISLAVTSVKQGEEDKVFAGLARLKEEDPSFEIVKNTETAETLIAGMGEIQLEVLVKKLKSKFNVEARLYDPKIPYRETIKKTVTAEGKHKKQSGGHGQYGHCIIKFEPCYEKDFEFAEEVVGGSVPKAYIPAVEKGLLECVAHGVLAGFPMVKIKCTLLDGSYHDVDSSEMAFKLAASLAYKKGCAEAAPTLLEPVMHVEIRVPDNYMGEIMGDLNRRRGRIMGMDGADGIQVITAEAPMAEMFKYSTDLRSMTQGRGSFRMELTRYDEVPPAVAAQIVAKAEKEKEQK